jgi:hypothetical protein
LNDHERELILKYVFADPQLTERLRIAPRPGELPSYRFTLDDLDDLAGYVAAEANHAKVRNCKNNYTGFSIGWRR